MLYRPWGKKMRESETHSLLTNTAARSSNTNSKESECRLFNPAWIVALVEKGKGLKPTEVKLTRSALRAKSGQPQWLW